MTTYTENYKEILKNAVNSNREYHQENNSLVMRRRKRRCFFGCKVKTKIDQDILNYDYQTRYAKLIVSWIREGLKNNEDVSKNYERLLDFYEDEINYKPKTKEKNNVVELPIQEKEDDTLDWVKEVEEREKFYTEFENDEEEINTLDVIHDYKPSDKSLELPF